jgi:hypothetical protein
MLATAIPQLQIRNRFFSAVCNFKSATFYRNIALQLHICIFLKTSFSAIRIFLRRNVAPQVCIQISNIECRSADKTGCRTAIANLQN